MYDILTPKFLDSNAIDKMRLRLTRDNIALFLTLLSAVAMASCEENCLNKRYCLPSDYDKEQEPAENYTVVFNSLPVEIFEVRTHFLKELPLPYNTITTGMFLISF